jgi:hypothetical protein
MNSRSLVVSFDRILMVSTVMVEYNTHSTSIVDTGERIKIPCHRNGRTTDVRNYYVCRPSLEDTVESIEIAVRELSLFTTSTPCIGRHTLLKSRLSSHPAI